MVWDAAEQALRRRLNQKAPLLIDRDAENAS